MQRAPKRFPMYKLEACEEQLDGVTLSVISCGRRSHNCVELSCPTMRFPALRACMHVISTTIRKESHRNICHVPLPNDRMTGRLTGSCHAPPVASSLSSQ